MMAFFIAGAFACVGNLRLSRFDVRMTMNQRALHGCMGLASPGE